MEAAAAVVVEPVDGETPSAGCPPLLLPPQAAAPSATTVASPAPVRSARRRGVRDRIVIPPPRPTGAVGSAGHGSRHDVPMDILRTPDECFVGLPEFPWEPQYVDVPASDGNETLRMAFVEAGPADGPVVLCLHGEPTWSFLYRKVLPVLADAGCRAIAF